MARRERAFIALPGRSFSCRPTPGCKPRSAAAVGASPAESLYNHADSRRLAPRIGSYRPRGPPHPRPRAAAQRRETAVSAPIWMATAFARPTAPATRHLRSAVLCLAAVFAAQGRALAQDNDRGGFTLLVNAGYAVQYDAPSGRSGNGQAGVNLGIGGFVTRNLALMLRLSETNVRSSGVVFGELDQASGVIGGTVQYWLSDRLAIEAGGGFGFVEDAYQADSPGLIFGATVTIFNRGKHSLVAGVEYAPAFRQSGTVSNVGFTIGYQFL